MAQSTRQQAANQRRTLATIRARLLQMAETWDGVDGYNVTVLTELADQAQKVAGELTSGDDQHGP